MTTEEKEHTEGVQAPKGMMQRVLNKIEVVGNKLPQPVTLFAILIGIVLVLSVIFGTMGISADHPSPDIKEPIKAVNLLTTENFRMIMTSMVEVFASFPPLGLVLVVMLGIGVAERSGMIAIALRVFVAKVPKKLITFSIVIAGMVSSVAADAGYVVLIPLGAAIFKGMGRHPLAGLAAAFAGVSGGFGANFLPTGLDPMIAAFTESAAAIEDAAYTVNPLSNYYLMAASVPLVGLAGTYVTEKIIVPRLGSYDGLGDEEYSNTFTKQEKKGLKWAATSVMIILALIVLAVIPFGTKKAQSLDTAEIQLFDATNNSLQGLDHQNATYPGQPENESPDAYNSHDDAAASVAIITPTAETDTHIPDKAALSVTNRKLQSVINEDGTVDVHFEISIQNTGNIKLYNLELVNKLEGSFPGTCSFTLQHVESGETDSLTLNPLYDGKTDVHLLGANNTIHAQETKRINLIVRVDQCIDEPVIFTSNASVNGINSGGVLRGPDGSMNPFYNSIVPLMFIIFFVSGLVYGIKAKTIKGDKDVANMTAEAMGTMGGYIVLAFVAAHLVQFFIWSNLGSIMAISGAAGLERIGFTGIPLLVAFILVSSLINLIIGSASAKWAILAPIFVPMLMFLGFSPETTQAAYRIGDSYSNILTPLLPYFPLVIVFAQKYVKNIGIGTIISVMLPYAIAFMIVRIPMFIAWILLNIPLGIEGPIYYP